MRFSSAPETRSIAIIGMAALFPQARSLQEYWQNIIEQRDCITDVPSTHWDVDDYYDADPNAPDKTYSKRGGFLPTVEFDPLQFGLPPATLEVTDTSQLLGLLVARQLLEDAGYGPDRDFDRSRTAVVLGVTGPQKLSNPLNSRLQYPTWKRVLRASGLDESSIERIITRLQNSYVGWNEDAMPGMLGNVIAGRIANRLNLGGMNCVVDAACASSLGAVKVAISELLEHRCDMIITGGVDTDASIFQYVSFSKTPAFTPGSHPRPFDQEADGMLPGEGIGMLLLKRLADAERDGDRIYAVIRGIGASSDGRHTSIYAPLPSGQASALQRAYEDAGISPATVGLIEAHGTGTPAGDLAEFSALRHVFEQSQSSVQRTALGSVKSQIGHTKSAAGAAGLIKAALALHHKILPPTNNVSKPNPKLDIESSPFYLNTSARPWLRGEHDPPRRAGVSSFGFGGTNFHIVLEEYQAEHHDAYRLQSIHQIIVLHAATPQELLQDCRAHAATLRGADAPQQYHALVQASAQPQIPAQHARLAIVAKGAEQATSLLDTAASLLERESRAAWQHPSGIAYRSASAELGRVVALFPGQGAQYLDMGRHLACNTPELRWPYQYLDALFEQAQMPPLSSIVYPPPVFEQSCRDAQAALLTQTVNAQPAIGALSAGMFRLLQHFGFAPDIVAGHSFGELTALWAANALSDEDFFRLAFTRGRLLTPPEGQEVGGMLAVVGDVEALKQHRLLRDGALIVANDNAPNQIVLAGPHQAIAAAQQTLQSEGYHTTRLPVAAAYHSALVSYADQPFQQALDQITFQRPSLQVYANSSAQPYPSEPDGVREVLKQHMLHPVRFREQIEAIYQNGGRIFVECGPRDILSKLVGTILGERSHITIALNPQHNGDSDQQFRFALAQLIVAGLPLSTNDQYELPLAPPKPPSASRTSILLNGANYLRDETKAMIERALNQPDPVNRSAEQPPPVVTPTEQAPTPAETIMSTSTAPIHPIHVQLDQYQRETERIHEQHLAQYAEISRQIGEVLQQLQQVSVGPQATNQALINALTIALSTLRDQQSALQQSFDRYIESRAEYMRLLLQQAQSVPVSRTAPAPVPALAPAAAPVSAPPPAPVSASVSAPELVPAFVPTPAPVPTPEPTPVQAAAPVPTPSSAPAPEPNALLDRLLRIISDKTGYPLSILEPSMDLESDLGIDSIKRVQILSALLEQHPTQSAPPQEEIAQLRTIEAIAAYTQQWLQGETAMPRTAEPPALAIPQPTLTHSDIKMRTLPPPDALACTLQPGHCCIITSDGTQLTTALADELTSQGWNVVVLDLPHTSLTNRLETNQDVAHYVLYEANEPALQQMLTLIQTRHGPCGAYLHLHPPMPEVQRADDILPEFEQEIVTNVFMIAKHLAEPLTNASQLGRSWFCTITQTDGQCGLGQQRSFPAISGGLVGLTKALNLEWERVFCRSIDLDDQLPTAQQVAYILAELHDTNRLVSEVGYHADQRLTLVSE